MAQQGQVFRLQARGRAQHEGEPETTEKLRWLLAKAVRMFGERRLSQPRSPTIAARRFNSPNAPFRTGH